MCCIPCQSHNKVEDDSSSKMRDIHCSNKMKRDIHCALCQKEGSLLFGSWELIGSGKNEAFLLSYFKKIPESKAGTYFGASKQLVHIKPSENESIWLMRTECDTMGATFIAIKFGEQNHELTMFRTSALVTYVRNGKNKITARYVSFAGTGPSCEVVREVKWWRPGRMITTITVGNEKCTRRHKRILMK